MARVLICWELGNGLAYIEGLAAAGRVISKAGHEVHFALRDLTHAERLLGERFPFYQAPTRVTASGMALPNPMTFADVLINLGYDNPASVVGRVRAWRKLLELVQPDIVRCAHAPGALLAARGTGIRSLAVGIGFLIPPARSPLPLLRTWAKGVSPERMAAREQAVLEGMNQALAALGAPKLASVGALYGDADLRELYTYPELDDYGPRDDVKYLGNFQAAKGAAPAWPDTPGKRIFAYLDPDQSTPMLLKALAGTGQPVLAYLPHAPEELLKQYASGNLKITAQPLDVIKTASLCDLGVSHGGHNIMGSFLGAGKPQLALPRLFPERVTAEKVAGCGAGLVARWDEADISQKLTQLLRVPAFADRAKAIAARVAHLSMEQALKNAVASVDQLAKAGPRK
ncbi:MAG TPA: nucleotide disphospho-sugar-binding domain-containing protein [Gammaproteobacteria bacterium]|jgi:UDP:flavonoid glycosyltransferase YjiC (YdhE family)|nr:nucleotide disphospho-sugar-binding domain-containing protein [Gammaproteobacteria bacterium]